MPQIVEIHKKDNSVMKLAFVYSITSTERPMGQFFVFLKDDTPHTPVYVEAIEIKEIKWIFTTQS